MVSRGALLGLLAVWFAGGCGRRAVAYHFRAPLVGAVNASPRLSGPDPQPGFDPRSQETRREPEADADRARYREPGPDHRLGPAGDARRRRLALALPSRPLRAGGSGEAIGLRGMVGRRDERSSNLVFALAAVRALGARLDPRLRSADDGPALRDLAAERGALVAAGDGAAAWSPSTGDLVLFDRVDGDQPASLVGVTVGTDQRGVIEFIYLGRGVVRRGYLSRAHPDQKRDPDGKVLNTFIRGSDGDDRRGTRYLAGELYSGGVRLDRLLR